MSRAINYTKFSSGIYEKRRSNPIDEIKTHAMKLPMVKEPNRMGVNSFEQIEMGNHRGEALSKCFNQFLWCCVLISGILIISEMNLKGTEKLDDATVDEYLRDVQGNAEIVEKEKHDLQIKYNEQAAKLKNKTAELLHKDTQVTQLKEMYEDVFQQASDAAELKDEDKKLLNEKVADLEQKLRLQKKEKKKYEKLYKHADEQLLQSISHGEPTQSELEAKYNRELQQKDHELNSLREALKTLKKEKETPISFRDLSGVVQNEDSKDSELDSIIGSQQYGQTPLMMERANTEIVQQLLDHDANANRTAEFQNANNDDDNMDLDDEFEHVSLASVNQI
eukprot:439452_1